MKKIFYILFVTAILTIYCQSVNSQGIILIPFPSAPLLEEYDAAFNHYKKVTLATFSDGYRDLKLQVVTKQEGKTLKDLSTQEQNVFILELARQQTKRMAKLQKAWSLELQRFDDLNYKPSTDTEKKLANKVDVERYSSQLLELRKTYAIAYENFALKALKEFGEKESELAFNQIKSIHDIEKLIQRNKE